MLHNKIYSMEIITKLTILASVQITEDFPIDSPRPVSDLKRDSTTLYFTFSFKPDYQFPFFLKRIAAGFGIKYRIYLIPDLLLASWRWIGNFPSK